MTDDSKLLNYILRNAELGKNSLLNIIPKIEDTNLELTLREHLKGYKQIYAFCEHKLQDYNASAEEINPILKGLNHIGNDLTTLNTATPHIAEMLIRDNNNGVINITKKIAEFSNVSEDTKKIADQLVKYEKDYVKDLEKFL